MVSRGSKVTLLTGHDYHLVPQACTKHLFLSFHRRTIVLVLLYAHLAYLLVIVVN